MIITLTWVDLSSSFMYCMYSFERNILRLLQMVHSFMSLWSLLLEVVRRYLQILLDLGLGDHWHVFGGCGRDEAVWFRRNGIDLSRYHPEYYYYPNNILNESIYLRVKLHFSTFSNLIVKFIRLLFKIIVFPRFVPYLIYWYLFCHSKSGLFTRTCHCVENNSSLFLSLVVIFFTVNEL